MQDNEFKIGDYVFLKDIHYKYLYVITNILDDGSIELKTGERGFPVPIQCWGMYYGKANGLVRASEYEISIKERCTHPIAHYSSGHKCGLCHKVIQRAKPYVTRNYAKISDKLRLSLLLTDLNNDDVVMIPLQNKDKDKSNQNDFIEAFHRAVFS